MVFDPDAYLASKGAEQPKAPVDSVPTDNTQVSQFDPDAYLSGKEGAQAQARQDKFGSLPQQYLAGMEGAVRGASLGASDYLEQHPELVGGPLGIAARFLKQAGQTTPEAIQGRQEANPVTSLSTQVVGGAPVAEGLGSVMGPAGSFAGQLGKGAAIGGVFGAGNAVSDAALGDPDLNAQKIAAHVASGALFGLGTEFALGALSKGIEAAPALYRRVVGDIPTNPGGGGEPPGGSAPVVDAPSSGVKPTSLEEMQAKVDKAAKSGEAIELPEKTSLVDAANRVDLDFPVHPVQADSLSDQSARDAYKIDREFPGERGDTIRNYEAHQKNELVSKVDQTIDGLAPKNINQYEKDIPSSFSEVSPGEFIKARDLSTKSQFLSPYSSEELKDSKLFLTKEGVGYALTPSGDMVNVFNNSEIPGAGKNAMLHGIMNGAKTLDAIGGFLPEYYSDFGFRLKNTIPWDDAYAPKGWDYGKNGRPDIVGMEFPENLSRLPKETQARVDLARMERLARRSGKQGPLSGLPVDGQHRTLDWSTWQGVGSKAPGSIERPMGVDRSPIGPTSDAVEGGNRAIKSFTEQYQAEKNALKPAFEQLKTTAMGEVDHLPGMIDKMTDAVPGVSRMFDTSGDSIEIKPYSTRWGLDESTYKAVKQAVSALNEKPASFEELANIRRGLDQHVDIMAQGQAPGQIRALKAAMMDYIQDAVQRATPDMEVRAAFKRYAINEQERAVIEKVFGASVGSPEFGAISKIKPENILDRVFANTANVKAAKSILEPEKFNELLSNWLAENRAKVTDKNTFSSNKFGSFLKRNQDALREAFSDNPKGLQRLDDLTTIMRILPDSASVNPSGTAKTLWQKIKSEPSVGGIIKSVGEKAHEIIGERAANAKLNARLAGKSDQSAKLSFISKISNGISEKISSASKAIIGDFNIPREVIPEASAIIGDKEYNKRAERIKELASDPQKMSDHMSENTEAMAHAAPNITQSLHTMMGNAVSFLSSKIPAPADHLLLSEKFEPSQTQMRQFNQYYNAVNSPLSVLRDVKEGTLTTQSIEALTAVHPHLYQEMKQQIMEKLDPEKARSLSYPVKMAIAKFVGSPLDQNMTPWAILGNQQSLNAPQLSQQSMPKQGRKTDPLGPMKNIKMASRVETRTQREDTEV